MTRGATARKRRSNRRKAGAAGVSKARSQGASLVAGATGSDYPLSDRERAWDSGAANGRWREKTGSTDKPSGSYKDGFMWYDSGSPGDFGSYKLQFADVVDGKTVAVWRAVVAIAGILQGARGGVDIPASDKTAVKAKVAGYYAKAREAFNDPAIKVPWSEDKASTESLAYALAYAEVGGAEEVVARTAYWAEALEGPMRCANCGHSMTMHANDMGTCTFEDDMGTCSCSKYMAATVVRYTGNMNIAANTASTANATFEVVTMPDEHQPQTRVPKKNPSPAAPDVDVNRTNASQIRWEATLCPENQVTDDGRMFAPDSITWRNLPLSLMVMTATADGHDGAWLGGRLDRIWRDGMNIRGEGVFTEDEEGQRAAKLVADGALTGVSVDIAVREYEIVAEKDLVDADGNVHWPPPESAVEEEGEGPTDLLEILFGESDEKQVLVVTDGVIGAVTVCPFPAFADAHISLSASAHVWTLKTQAGFRLVREPVALVAGGAEALTAAAAGLAPLVPPAEWFEDPGLDEPTPLSVTEEGRIFGHAADWETCHIGIPNACTTAPHSPTDYSLFHLGAVVADDGAEIPIGKITLGTGHAPKHLGWQEAAAHYDNTGTVVADVVCGEDDHGIWVAGALRPDVPAERVRELRAAVLSGDWRDFNGALELVALLAVNVPGFPIPRKRALVAAGEDGASVLTLVAAGITTGLPREESKLKPDDMKRLRVLADRASGKTDYLAQLARLAEVAHRPFDAKTDTFYSDDQPRDDHGRWDSGGTPEGGDERNNPQTRSDRPDDSNGGSVAPEPGYSASNYSNHPGEGDKYGLRPTEGDLVESARGDFTGQGEVKSVKEFDNPGTMIPGVGPVPPMEVPPDEAKGTAVTVETSDGKTVDGVEPKDLRLVGTTQSAY